jgi:hypothetical protein
MAEETKTKKPAVKKLEKKREVGTVEVPKPKVEAKPAPIAAKPAPKPQPKSQSRSVVVEEVKTLPKVTLDVYLLAKGVKPDQTAGFRAWMKNRKVRRQTMTEWDAMWGVFQARPVTNRR